MLSMKEVRAVWNTGEPGGAGTAHLAALAEDSGKFIGRKGWGAGPLHPLTTLRATLWVFRNVRKCHRDRE